jgi:hypothetical protein
MEGLFGAIIFGKANRRIHTFYEIERKYVGRYGVHMVHLRKPLLEWAGNDLLKIEMKINLNAAWCGDPNPILAEWHLFHENALAAPLIIGGKPMGPMLSLFVIDELTEHQKYWLKGGQLIGVELTVSFTEYIPFAEGFTSSLGIPGFPSGNPTPTGGTVEVGQLENITTG